MAIPFLNNINLDDNQLQNAKLHVTSSAPAAEAGQIYYNSTANEVRYYNGSAWVSLVASTGGTVTSVTSGDANTITISGTATDPTIAANTAAIANGSANLATGDQIYDFVIGQNYSTTTGTVTSVAIAGTDGIDVDSGSPITSSGTITLGLSNVPNASLANSSITIGDSTIALGGTDTTLTGLTDIDLTAGNKTIFDGVGANTLTIGAGTTTIAIPGDLVVTGTTTTNNVETVSTSNGVIFEGNAADANELTLLAGTLTSDRTVTLPDATGTVALTSNLLTTKTALIDVSSMGSNTTATITHNINSAYLIVQLYDVTTGEVVFADIDHTSANATSVIFSQTPTNDIRVVIIDAGTGIGTITPTYS